MPALNGCGQDLMIMVVILSICLAAYQISDVMISIYMRTESSDSSPLLRLGKHNFCI